MSVSAGSGGTQVGQAQAASPVAPLGFVPALDGVRALAILLVVTHHFSPIFPGGFVGVDLFFVLSGFLITTLLLDEHRHSGRVSLRAFVGRRAVRLGPALALLLVVDLALRLFVLDLDPAASVVAVARPLSFMNNWLTIWGAPLNELTPTWSLSVEEQFYLLWPAVLLFVCRRARDLSVVARRVLIAGIAVSGWCVTVYLATGDSIRALWGSDTRTAGILLGAALALGRASGVTNRWSPTVVRTAGRAGIVVLIGFALIGNPDHFLYLTLVIALAGAALVHSATLGHDRVLQWGFTRPVAAWVGRRSYGIYLWHELVRLFVVWLWVGIGAVQLIAVGIPVTLACAALSFRFVEQPVTRWARARRTATTRPSDDGTEDATVDPTADAIVPPASTVDDGVVIDLRTPSEPADGAVPIAPLPATTT